MFTEQYMLEFVSYFKSKFPDTNKLCLAGGLFANVKLNQKINEYAGFDEIFIAPAMSDEGLALGAAIAKSVELGEFKVKKIKNAFLGIETIDLEEVEDIEIEPLDPIKVASWLKDNKVIGVFANRREWGPRALGGTSIMYNPTDPNAQNYINFRLNRSEVMPFAPVVLDGYEEELFYCYKSKYASEFMTLCYNVKEQWVEKIPGVINIFDGTARPQIAKKDNEPFYSILTEFYNQTGVPSTMNTSFNVHGEPIINTLHEALKHLKNGVIDYLITNNKIYKLKL
jgi:carbamoyltransferase